MAIYYIDPHTTINGSGTWASPWSLNSSTRTGLAAGDEIRIKGVALTSLLTATSYTATLTNTQTLTITAGGGLGADWAAGDVGYLPDYDTFFKVVTVATNAISVSTSSILPIYNWSVTSLTVRRVNLASYPVGSTSSLNIGSATAINSITVSDCWTDATTQVTDGSVKSLLNSSSAATITFYPTTVTSLCSSWVVNLQNTVAMCGALSNSVYLDATSSTINIGQVFSNGTAGGFNGNSSYPTTGTTVNITHLAAPTPMSGFGSFGQGNTFNITNLSANYTDYLFGSSATCACTGNTVNLTNVFASTTGSATAIFSFTSANELTLNFTGVYDFYGATQPTILFNGAMSGNITISSSVVGYYNKRTSTIATIGTKASIFVSNYPVVFAPNITVNNSWTFTNKYNSGGFGAIPTSSISNLPCEILISLPNTTDLPSGAPYGFLYALNQTVIGRDGSAPFQNLAIYGLGLTSNVTNTQTPKVTTDATVYKTIGPSLKAYLATRTSAYWLTKAARAVKTIKVPCVAGTSYTVSGFIRTDDASYVNGDVRCSIYFNDLEVIGRDMTTSCVNAWEQFTLTFTASQTAEYVFVWKMYYENGAKSYWLDDLTIV